MARKTSAIVARRVQTPCRLCPLREMNAFRKFTEEELCFVEKFKASEIHASAGQTILIENESSAHLYTVLSGWLMKYKMLEDGRRQIINFAVPGDLLGLQAATFGKMQHSVEALTDVTLCVFPKRKVWSLYEHHQGLGFDVTWIAAEEKTILADFLVCIGQRTAGERIAFLLLTLYRRARSVGLVKNKIVRFPFTQEHFSDTIGFSLVHTNKCLARLKRLRAFEWVGETFTMLDEELLADLVGRPALTPGPKPFL